MEKEAGYWKWRCWFLLSYVFHSVEELLRDEPADEEEDKEELWEEPLEALCIPKNTADAAMATRRAKNAAMGRYLRIGQVEVPKWYQKSSSSLHGLSPFATLLS
jgi:hypothetical protein